jgi:hypothetical protein
MLETFPTRGARNVSVTSEQRRNRVREGIWLALLLGASLAATLQMVRQGPNLANLAWMIYFTGLIAIIYRPRYGMYLILALTLTSDSLLMPWYPFVKNFSSYESLMYVSPSLIFSPLETYIVATYLSWLGRMLAVRRILLVRGPLFWPALVFIGFVTFGLFYGLARGGDTNVALWEARSIYYLPALLVLVTNLIETRRHVRSLLWCAIIGIFVNGLVGTSFVAFTLNWDISTVERIARHGTSIQANTFIVLLLALWMYRGSYSKRLIMPVMLPFVLISYFANQRRAAFLTLAIALLLLAIVLYRERRTAFWLVVPIFSVLAGLYLGAFWNASGPVAQPARAIKSVLSSDAGNTRDYASNLYRIIENANVSFTIHQAPLTGVGFGKKFYIIAPLPDISWFVWWEYITHNSILWMWMKAGVGGFVSMLFLFGMAVLVGARVVCRMPGGEVGAAALTATLYIVMHLVFTYVDMGWDLSSMVYVGTMMGLLNSLERIVSRQDAMPPRRWPWQPEAKAPLGLRLL